MKYVTDYSMEFINDINWLDLFSIFTDLKIKKDDFNVKLYQHINRNIASIRDINSLWLDSYKEFSSNQTDYEKQWNSSIIEIGKQIDIFVHWL